jgi:hypothetical protein
MGKSKVADFMLLYGAVSVTLVGLWGLYAKMYWTGLGCLAMGAACFAFDRWARKRGL